MKRSIPVGKLVRDGVPALIGSQGLAAVCSRVEPHHMVRALQAKLFEEAAEYASSESVAELADVLEVVKALAVLHGFTLEDVAVVARKKREERGGFDNGVFLVAIEVPE